MLIDVKYVDCTVKIYIIYNIYDTNSPSLLLCDFFNNTTSVSVASHGII